MNKKGTAITTVPFCKTYLLLPPSENRFFSTETDLVPKERILRRSSQFSDQQQLASISVHQSLHSYSGEAIL